MRKKRGKGKRIQRINLPLTREMKNIFQILIRFSFNPRADDVDDFCVGDPKHAYFRAAFVYTPFITQ